MASVEQELEKRCRGFPLHTQVDRQNPVVCVLIRWPIGDVAWYVAGYDSMSYTAFGYCSGLGNDGWRYFTVLSVFSTTIAGVRPSIDKTFKPAFASRLGLPTQRVSLKWG